MLIQKTLAKKTFNRRYMIYFYRTSFPKTLYLLIGYVVNMKIDFTTVLIWIKAYEDNLT